jgi:FKBP-type peptidyl-prolyl cis-trans isomerase FkpA
MKKNIVLFLLPAMLSLGACSEYKKGKGALRYKIVKDKNTPTVAKLAVVFLTYTEAAENGKVLSQTGKFDPMPTEVYSAMPRFEGDLQDAFPNLSEGDSAVVKVSMDSLKKGGYAQLPFADRSKYMVYTLKLNRVINQLGQGDSTFLERVEDYKQKQMLQRKADEEGKIKAYLKVRKLSYKATASGLLYPSGLKLADNTGKEIYVRYTLSSLDGKLYLGSFKKIELKKDQAISKENYQADLALGQIQVPGFMEAISVIPKGTKTKMIIPSRLAYGSRGNNNTPPFTPLLCEFEILNK